MVQKMETNKTGASAEDLQIFSRWLTKMEKKSCGTFMVPHSIKMLPCGCVRSVETRNAGWNRSEGGMNRSSS